LCSKKFHIDAEGGSRGKGNGKTGGMGERELLQGIGLGETRGG